MMILDAPNMRLLHTHPEAAQFLRGKGNAPRQGSIPQPAGATLSDAELAATTPDPHWTLRELDRARKGDAR